VLFARLAALPTTATCDALASNCCQLLLLLLLKICPLPLLSWECSTVLLHCMCWALLVKDVSWALTKQDEVHDVALVHVRPAIREQIGTSDEKQEHRSVGLLLVTAGNGAALLSAVAAARGTAASCMEKHVLQAAAAAVRSAPASIDYVSAQQAACQ
jgi:hypothetical protein